MNKKLVLALCVMMLMGGVSVTAATFEDLSPNHFAYEAIEEMVEKGIVSGFPDGTFRQHQSVTRAEAAVIISRALDLETSEGANVSFTDISPQKTYAYPAIAALTERKIFADGKKFYPNRTLTRAEMSKILVLAFQLEGETNVHFTDVKANHWVKPYLDPLIASGVTKGVGNHRFDPNGQVTRGQMAVFITRALDPQSAQNDKTPGVISEEEKLEKTILELVNKERRNVGLPPVKWASDVAKVARLKSADMLKHNYFSHQSPTYGSPFEMMKKYGIIYREASENIAHGYQRDAEKVMNGFINSKSHRDNILAKSVTEVGIGVAFGPKINDVYYTQMFVRR